MAGKRQVVHSANAAGDQTAVLFGKSAKGARESLLTFIGPDLVAARWKQWRFYFKDMQLTGTGQQMPTTQNRSASTNRLIALAPLVLLFLSDAPHTVQKK